VRSVHRELVALHVAQSPQRLGHRRGRSPLHNRVLSFPHCPWPRGWPRRRGGPHHLHVPFKGRKTQRCGILSPLYTLTWGRTGHFLFQLFDSGLCILQLLLLSCDYPLGCVQRPLGIISFFFDCRSAASSLWCFSSCWNLWESSSSVCSLTKSFNSFWCSFTTRSNSFWRSFANRRSTYSRSCVCFRSSSRYRSPGIIRRETLCQLVLQCRLNY